MRVQLAIGAAACLLAVAGAACRKTATLAHQLEPPRPGVVFPSTFSDQSAKPEADPFIGHWRSGNDELVLVPRASRGGATGLFGSIPTGPLEGAVWLSRVDGGEWQGIHVSARSGTRLDASLSRETNSQSINVAIGSVTRAFAYAGRANLAWLSEVAIYGHRAGGLGKPERENTLSAIADCWLLGCSGVEVDVTVPFTSGRRPVPSELRVHHPAEWRAELMGFDSTDQARLSSAPRLPDALRVAADAGLAGVYVDVKLKWLMARHRDAAAAAVNAILQDAAATPQLVITIGAETSNPGQAADMLAAARDARRFPDHARWALEITRGTDFKAAAARVQGRAGAPDALSWNLLALSGGGGGWLRWFVRTVPNDVEAALGTAGLQMMLWTADADQFDAALVVLQRLRRPGSPAAIMTAYPHRLAFFLATRP